MNNNKSMCSVYKYIHILSSILETYNIPGDMVEMGCYMGGTSKVISVANPNKNLYVYDSFEGLPDKHLNDENDLSRYNEPEGNLDFKKGILKCSEFDLINNFNHDNLKIPTIKKSWFKDLSKKDIPEKISFVFLDGDFYESINDCLNLIYDNVVAGGIILIDDYDHPALPGVKKATDDFLKNKNDCIYKECEQRELVHIFKIKKI